MMYDSGPTIDTALTNAQNQRGSASASATPQRVTVASSVVGVAVAVVYVQDGPSTGVDRRPKNESVLGSGIATASNAGSAGVDDRL